MGWLATALGFHAAVAALVGGWFLVDGAAPWSAVAGRAALGLVGVAGLALGLRGLRQVTAVDFGAGRLLGAAASLTVAAVGFDAAFAAAWGTPLSTTLAGAVAGLALVIAAAFAMLIAALRLLLRINLSVFAVARQVLEETLRMKLAMVFLTALVLAIAALPFIVSDNDALRYQVQQFLAYSLSVTAFLLGLLTIFAACSTLSGEIEGKQAFTVMTKPIDRGRYLLGKWLGLTLLNIVLLAVAGGAVYGFVTLYMVQQPAMDAMDRASLHEEVLTARVAVAASMPTMGRDEARSWVERFVRGSGGAPEVEELISQIGGRGALVRGLMEYGAIQARAVERLRDQLLGGGAAYINEQGGAAEALEAARRRLVTEWRSMGPMGQSHNSTTFVFENLEDATSIARSVQLQFKLKGSGGVGSTTRIGWQVNGRTIGTEQYPLRIQQTMMLPVEAIDDAGRLVVRAHNLNPAGSVTFEREEGVKLYYTAGRFGPNLARAMGLMAVKLAFLTALGLTAATFLGFPVAALLSLLVFVGAEASPFILESLEGFGRTPEGTAPWAQAVGAFITALGAVLRQYASFEPTTSITHGRLIPWATLGLCVAWIGLLWTGATFLVGWLVFRKRELARVQV